MMCIMCNILCFAIAIANFDSETCNTPQRDCGKVEQERSARIYGNVLSKVPCRCTKQCIIRIPQLYRIRIWTES